MKYYAAADVHGFTTKLRLALERTGFFDDAGPRRLILLGDFFDRGHEAREMQDFILEHRALGDLILVRGNHEDLYERLVTTDRGLPVRPHVGNGTYDTALQLTGIDPDDAVRNNMAFAAAARATPYYREIIPATIDYFETAHYIFVHGWIPGFGEDRAWDYDPAWREAGPEAWRRARWINGMDAAQNGGPGKTVLCGHYHSSYGHARYENRGSEYGHDADFSPYYGPGVIALDACTAYSGQLNVLVLADEDA